MAMQFYKYHGTGNDFIVIDDRERKFNETDQALVEQMCHRRFGIGADGLILLRNHEEHDFEMIYFNSDGRVSSMCGNGGRCIVQFAFDLGLIRNKTTFLAVDGVHHAEITAPGQVALQMQNVDAVENIGEDFYLNTGSPHYVKFVPDVEAVNVGQEGSRLRNSERWKAEGVNVNFFHRKERGKLRVRTYERGVEAETMSCGTGVVAAAIANFSAGGAAVADITTPGGALEVSFQAQDGRFFDVWLKGPAEKVFVGEW